jgi:DNA-binding NtrC family response regulator
VVVPPLRERQEDIPLLVKSFAASIAEKSGKPVAGVSQAALEVMVSYPWPGNVRELLNALEYAVVLCPGGEILPEHLPPKMAQAPPAGPAPAATGRRQERQRQELVRALRECGGNQSEAARRLGVSRVTVWNRCKRLGVDPHSPA